MRRAELWVGGVVSSAFFVLFLCDFKKNFSLHFEVASTFCLTPLSFTVVFCFFYSLPFSFIHLFLNFLDERERYKAQCAFFPSEYCDTSCFQVFFKKNFSISRSFIPPLFFIIAWVLVYILIPRCFIIPWAC